MYLTHITTEGERWDQIAMRYYGDALLYETIILANPTVPLHLVLPSGLTLTIPLIKAKPTLAALPPWLR